MRAGSSQATLTIIGDVSVDQVMGPIARWPDVGTETLMELSELRAGGSAGNTAIACRALGVPCRLVAQYGDDTLGRWLAAQFAGIDTSFTVIPNAPTSLSVGLIHSCGERTFFTTRGHLEYCEWPPLCAQIDREPPPGSIAIFTGAFLLPRLQADYDGALRNLRDLGYGIAIDTGWPSGGWTDEQRAKALDWIVHCDHLLLNEAEVCALANESELRAAMHKVAHLLPKHGALIAKRGAQGAMAVRDGGYCEQQAPSATVFDTIGAGDAFNAGYLAARLRSDDLGTALRAGCAAATAIIARFPRGSIRAGEVRV